MKADKIDYYHGCLGVTEAERRLRESGEHGAYLVRMSDVQENRFIISSINHSSVAHILSPNGDGKFLKQTFDEASPIIMDIVQNCEGYIYPLAPSGPLKKFHKGDNVKDGETCYSCSFTNSDSDPKTLFNHMSTHKLKWCQECKKYFKQSTFVFHRKFCNASANVRLQHEILCQICDYKTIHSSTMKKHEMMHQTRPFLCKEENCRRCFKTEEELNKHTGFHRLNGFKCDVCDKMFIRPWEKKRHMSTVHQRDNIEQERTGYLILNKNGNITIKVDEYQSKKVKRHILKLDQDNNHEKKVDVTKNKSMILSSPRTIHWTCINDVIKLSEETKFQDISVICRDGLVRANKIILASLFPPLCNIFSSISFKEEVDTVIFPEVKSEDLRQLLVQFYELNRGASTIELQSEMDMKDDFDIEELDPLDEEIMIDLDEEFKSELMDEEQDDEDEDKEEQKTETSTFVQIEEGFEPGGSGKEIIKTFELKITRGGEKEQGRTMIQCPLCDFKTRLYSKDRLPIHFQSKHTNRTRSKSVPCPICGMMNADLEKHMSRFHTEVTCEICGKILKSRARYYVHHDKEHGKKKVVIPEGMEQCRKCREFVGSKDIREHSCQNQFPCEICGKIYHNLVSLQSHVNNTCRPKKEGTKHSCEQCGKSFHNKSTLIKHLKTHDPLNPCPECGKLVRDLDDHMKGMHTDDRDKRFQCKDCGKGFIDKEKLERHKINVHLKLRPYICRYDGCDVSYNDVSNRNQHEKRVHRAVKKNAKSL